LPRNEVTAGENMSFIKTTSIAGLVKLGIIVAALLYAALFIMTAGHPVIEAHSFRQTQTAISVFYMLSGEGLFNYITPVTGAPWTIPFEAPVYHISVALLSQISPFSLDTNGRIVSAIYWAGCLFFGYKIFRLALPEKPLTAAIFVLLALCSPLYIFWSRTFMIETSTLFFGFVFLYAVMRFTAEGRYWLVGLAVISGVLCILAKATTWPAFVVAGGVYFLSYNMKFLVSFRPANIARPDTLRFIARGCLLLLAVLIALWVGLSWTHHSDAMKLQTHFGEGLTSGALSAWNFGTGADRLSGQFWNATVMERALPEAIGLFWFIPIFGLAGLFISKDRDRIFSKEIALIAIGTALFLLPMLIFTNLHMVHNYYQVGSSIFIIAVVAVIIGAMLTSSRMTQILGVFTIVMILIGQVFVFLTGYFPRRCGSPSGLGHR